MLQLLPEALGWTVVHSVWQIAVVYIFYRAIAGYRGDRPQRRYSLALLAMAACTVWSGFTLGAEYERLKAVQAERALLQSLTPTQAAAVGLPTSPAEASQHAGHPATATATTTATATATATTILSSWLDSHAHLFGWLWCIGVLVLSVRLLGGYYLAQRLRRRYTLPLPGDLQLIFEQWKHRLGLGARVQGLLSTRVPEPLTLGFWKPVVLFPATLVTQLPPDQLEALLVHELAHVRRADYLVNLAQLFLELCFFYHPLFYGLSRDARRAREGCCDDLVIRYTTQRLPYAQALTTLQLALVHTKNPFAMHALGNSHFTQRILRIAGVQPQKSGRTHGLALFLLLLVLALGAGWSGPSAALHAADFELLLPNRFALAPATAQPADTTPPRRAKPAARPAPAAPAAQPAPAGVAVAPVRMNVLYIGVDNPVRIAAAGVPASEVFVRLEGAGEIVGSGVDYTVTVREPGQVKIHVFRRAADGNVQPLNTEIFRVKRIPDPTPMIDGRFRGGSIPLEEVAQFREITPVLQNFEFDAGCTVVGFGVTVLPKDGDPYERPVQGGVLPSWFGDAVKNMPNGGSLFFDDIQVQCPGDASPRNVGGLAVKAKKGE